MRACAHGRALGARRVLAPGVWDRNKAQSCAQESSFVREPSPFQQRAHSCTRVCALWHTKAPVCAGAIARVSKTAYSAADSASSEHTRSGRRPWVEGRRVSGADSHPHPRAQACDHRAPRTATAPTCANGARGAHRFRVPQEALADGRLRQDVGAGLVRHGAVAALAPHHVAHSADAANLPVDFPHQLLRGCGPATHALASPEQHTAEARGMCVAQARALLPARGWGGRAQSISPMSCPGPNSGTSSSAGRARPAARSGGPASCQSSSSPLPSI